MGYSRDFSKRGTRFYEEKTITNQSPFELTGGSESLHQTNGDFMKKVLIATWALRDR